MKAQLKSYKRYIACFDLIKKEATKRNGYGGNNHVYIHTRLIFGLHYHNIQIFCYNVYTAMIWQSIMRFKLELYVSIRLDIHFA